APLGIPVVAVPVECGGSTPACDVAELRAPRAGQCVYGGTGQPRRLVIFEGRNIAGGQSDLEVTRIEAAHVEVRDLVVGGEVDAAGAQRTEIDHGRVDEEDLARIPGGGVLAVDERAERTRVVVEAGVDDSRTVDRHQRVVQVDVPEIEAGIQSGQPARIVDESEINGLAVLGFEMGAHHVGARVERVDLGDIV